MLSRYSTDVFAAKGYGNMVLYRMCEEKPLHRNETENGLDAIAGKTWLIGRAYAASPQRGAGEADPDGEQDFFRKLAEWPTWRELDDQLSHFTSASTFGGATLDEVLRTHEFLVRLLCNFLRSWGAASNGNPRRHTSFASKYLHFHRPDHFPIYDSMVNQALCGEFERYRISRRITDVDGRYERFCKMVIEFHAKHPTFGSLRDIDHHLYERQRAENARRAKCRQNS